MEDSSGRYGYFEVGPVCPSCDSLVTGCASSARLLSRQRTIDCAPLPSTLGEEVLVSATGARQREISDAPPFLGRGLQGMEKRSGPFWVRLSGYTAPLLLALPDALVENVVPIGGLRGERACA